MCFVTQNDHSLVTMFVIVNGCLEATGKLFNEQMCVSMGMANYYVYAFYIYLHILS